MPKPQFSLFNDDFYKRKNTMWSGLIGDPSQFKLESRIFHSISIGLIIIASIYVPYNLYAGLYVASVSALVFGLFFLYQYYYSRFHGKPHSNTIFGLTGILLFGVNYFSNSGINGSTDLIWPAYLLIIFAISPYQQHTKWLIIYLVCFLALHAVEYYHPNLVKHPFTVGTGQFIDRITAFPLPVFVIFIVIRLIRASYDTERKAAEISNEQILLQKEELEQRNIEKNKLMSIISHDLKTPLFNIQNYLALLNENGLDNEDRQTLEKALLNATNNSVEMLSNLLHWSKSQMEGIYVNLMEVNLFEILNGTLEMEKIHAVKKEITLSIDIQQNINVIADVDMLQLVVRNLISNAIKFTPQGGTIGIHAETILNACKITVSDNGKGIAPDEKDKIFSIKAAPTFGTNNERGVGLGLVLCKEFIEKQGGRISFESSLGHGSSFSIFLPLETEA